jgi:transposase
VKTIRSTTCSLKFASQEKRDLVRIVIAEYSRLVNLFIDRFWKDVPEKRITKIKIDSWLSAGLKREAANEAIYMIKATKNAAKSLKCEYSKPKHSGKSIRLRDMNQFAELQFPEETTYFDYWLHLKSIGDGLIFDLPIKSHKHFKNLQKRGRMNQACLLSPDKVQFSFEIETGTKREEGRAIGIDLGINHFLATSEGELLGDIKPIIEKMLRKRPGSKGRRGQAIHLRNEMNRTIKSLPSEAKTLYVERLKGISSGTKQRRVQKRTRCLIGSWNQGYALSRIQRFCEDNRVAFRSVSPYQTSITCSACGKADKKNRVGDVFRCSCSHREHADINAAKNILQRGEAAAARFSIAMVDAAPKKHIGENSK